MNRKLKAFWDKHEGWVAPIAMLLFLMLGWSVGQRVGAHDESVRCAARIDDMSKQIERKDGRIEDKDRRLREIQDHTNQITAEAAQAAREAAEAAKLATEKSTKE